MIDRRERRTTFGEVRSAGDGMAFSGYAAMFNSRTYIGPPNRGFFEEIQPGAFDAVLDQDVRCLFNHDINFVLGRTTAGTLRLKADDRGLYDECDLPDSPNGRNISTSIARGDITGQSFSFEVAEDDWRSVPGNANAVLRVVKRYAVVYDVGPVAFPAYEDTTANVRSAVQAVRQARQATGIARGERRQLEKRGLVSMVQATDAATDAAGDAIAAGNVAQAGALFQAAQLALNEAHWELWGVDPELLSALGCPDVEAACDAAWDAIWNAIQACASADKPDAEVITAAIQAADALLAALRLPDADAPATDSAQEDDARKSSGDPLSVSTRLALASASLAVS